MGLLLHMRRYRHMDEPIDPFSKGGKKQKQKSEIRMGKEKEKNESMEQLRRSFTGDRLDQILGLWALCHKEVISKVVSL